MKKQTAVEKILDELVKRLLKEIISHWERDDERYIFHWLNSQNLICGFILYEFAPKIYRISLNREILKYLPVPHKELEIKWLEFENSWGCEITINKNQLEKTLNWLADLIKAKDKLVFMRKKLPKFLQSLGNEQQTNHPQLWSQAALDYFTKGP